MAVLGTILVSSVCEFSVFMSLNVCDNVCKVSECVRSVSTKVCSVSLSHTHNEDSVRP